MKTHLLSSAAAALLLIIMPASAADDVGLARLALCQDSWLDWSKTNPAQLQKMGAHIGAGFSHHDNDPFAVPNAPTSVMGLRIVQAYPDSVGMGVGFSLLVDAPFGTARGTMEKALGKKLSHCEAGDGMHSCELQIAEKRTAVLMTADNEKNRTLVGCYYYYER
jgi:hypothetical protein